MGGCGSSDKGDPLGKDLHRIAAQSRPSEQVPPSTSRGYGTKLAYTTPTAAELAGPQFPISVVVAGDTAEHLIRPDELVVRLKVRIFDIQVIRAAQLRNSSSEPAALPGGWEQRQDPDGKIYFVNHNDQTTHWEPPGPLLCDIPPPVATSLVFSTTTLRDETSLGSNGIVDGAQCLLEWEQGIQVTIKLPKLGLASVLVWPQEPLAEMKSRVLGQLWSTMSTGHQICESVYNREWSVLRGETRMRLQHDQTVGENLIQTWDVFSFRAEERTLSGVRGWSSGRASNAFQQVVDLGVMSDPVQQLTVRYTWNDQGWGNQKGRIRLRAGSTNAIVDHALFGLAPHNSSSHVTVVSRLGHEEFMDAICAQPFVVEGLVGGGGGHQLNISSLTIDVQYE